MKIHPLVPVVDLQRYPRSRLGQFLDGFFYYGGKQYVIVAYRNRTLILREENIDAQKALKIGLIFTGIIPLIAIIYKVGHRIQLSKYHFEIMTASSICGSIRARFRRYPDGAVPSLFKLVVDQNRIETDSPLSVDLADKWMEVCEPGTLTPNPKTINLLRYATCLNLAKFNFPMTKNELQTILAAWKNLTAVILSLRTQIQEPFRKLNFIDILHECIFPCRMRIEISECSLFPSSMILKDRKLVALDECLSPLIRSFHKFCNSHNIEEIAPILKNLIHCVPFLSSKNIRLILNSQIFIDDKKRIYYFSFLSFLSFYRIIEFLKSNRADQEKIEEIKGQFKNYAFWDYKKCAAFLVAHCRPEDIKICMEALYFFKDKPLTKQFLIQFLSRILASNHLENIQTAFNSFFNKYQPHQTSLSIVRLMLRSIDSKEKLKVFIFIIPQNEFGNKIIEMLKNRTRYHSTSYSLGDIEEFTSLRVNPQTSVSHSL